MKACRRQCLSSLFLVCSCSKTRSLWVWRSILRRKARFQAWCLCGLACWPWDRWGLKESDAKSWLLLARLSDQSCWFVRKALHCYSIPWKYESCPRVGPLHKSGRCSNVWGHAGARSPTQSILQLPDPRPHRKSWLLLFIRSTDALPFELSRNRLGLVFILTHKRKYSIRIQKPQVVFLGLWLRIVSALDWVLSSTARVSLHFSPSWSQYYL